jgi:hypothetical protein
VFDSPPTVCESALNSINGSDRCWDLYSNLKTMTHLDAKITSGDYDIIVNIQVLIGVAAMLSGPQWGQGDEPLVNPEHIDRLVEALKKDSAIKIS